MNYQQPNYYTPNYYGMYPQQYQTPMPSAPQLRGRVVNSANDILPNEIPMDGSISYFPLQDGSGVIGKQWNSDGTIKTYTYTAVVDISSQEPSFEDTVLSKLDILNTKLASLLES